MTRHIAILLPDLRGGGVERVRLLLAREWAAAGHRVTIVLVRAGGELMDEVPDGVALHVLGAMRFRDVPLRLLAWLRRDRPDVLIAAMWPLTGIALAVHRLARVKTRLIVSEHNDLRHTPAVGRTEKALLRRAGRMLYRRANGIVAVSNGVADSLHALTGIARGAITTIYNPIRTPSRADLPGDDDDVRWWHGGGHRLLAIGALKPQKGIDILIEAVAELVRRDTLVRLLILGDGREHDRLAAQIAELGLAASVRLAGFRPDPFPFLRAADLFVLSSRWEGLGNVITEAMSVGTPVVATDCPSGPAELLEYGRFGRLVPIDDAGALAREIEQELAAPHAAAQLRARAAEFDVAAAARHYLDLAMLP